MKDIGILTGKAVPTSGLRDVIESFSRDRGLEVKQTDSESVVGRLPDAVYVKNLTPENNAYYDDGERRDLELKIGFEVGGYVSIHFTATDVASRLANELAEYVVQTWGGVIDFSGAGGDVGSAPP
jgi:hypothetical protein